MARLLTIAALVSIAFSALAAGVSSGQDASRAYVIVVHPANQHGVARRAFLADAFLKKVSRWANGTVIRAADLSYGSQTREAFSQAVLRRSVSAVRAYWQQRIFGGLDIPPPQFDNDGEVVSYVLSHEGAVGYVSARAELRQAKVLELTD
jgi:ABC-type phosphate transport system substrate-binding protein